MIIGDRVFFQKNVNHIKYGDLGTVVGVVDEHNLIIRVDDDFVGSNTSAIRKATKDEVESYDTQKLINNSFRSGTLHIVRIKDCTDQVSLGDVGFIIGANAFENEQNDLFTVDFGDVVLKLDKKFMDTYMGKYNHGFESKLTKEENI